MSQKACLTIVMTTLFLTSCFRVEFRGLRVLKNGVLDWIETDEPRPIDGPGAATIPILPAEPEHKDETAPIEAEVEGESGPETVAEISA